MKIKTKQILIIANFILLFILTSFSALKEEGYRKKEYFYLKLAPVDPRSLMQGDYMILNYELTEEAISKIDEVYIDNRNLKKGYIVAKLDENNVAIFEDIVEEVNTNEKDKLFISFKYDGYRSLNINANTFLFQEGDAHLYEKAQYSKVVIVNNTLRLIDLVDEIQKK